MSEDDNLEERGRAIFARLRSLEAEDVATEAPHATVESTPSHEGSLHEESEGREAAHEAAHTDADPEAEAHTPRTPVVGAPSPGPSDVGDAIVSPAGDTMDEAGPAPRADPAPTPAGTTLSDLAEAGEPALGDGLPSSAEPVEPASEAPPDVAHIPVATSVLAPPLPQGTPPVLPAMPATEGDVAQPGDAGPVVDASVAPAASEETVAPASPFLRPLPRVMAIANQKGGVGKTTTAVNLGASLADLGYRVLVIDLDPQGNATTGLGVNPRNLEASIYDVLLHDVPIEDCIEPTSLRNLFVVPATIDLAGAEIELVPAFSRELRLKRALAGALDDFDFMLIDCPPSLGLITVNGLAAATEVVVPIQCEYYALEGLGQLLRNVNLVQGNLNPGLQVSAIILTMYDARTKLAEQVATEVRTHFGERVCRNIVPRTVRLSEAPSFGQPIIVFDPSSRGAIAYRELAKEVSGGTPQRVG